MGGKALHKTTEREREPSLTCLTVPSYRTYIPFPSVTSSLRSASTCTSTDDSPGRVTVALSLTALSRMLGQIQTCHLPEF